MMEQIKKNILLSSYTTLHTGGVADYLVEVFSKEELKVAFLWAKANTKTPPLILGGGSNVLISDYGYRGLVIINRIKRIVYEVSERVVKLNVGAGETLDEVIRDAVNKEYWGLENLSSIPGSVGATPVQNVGAYGVEVADLIESVTAIHVDTQEEKNFRNEECCFAYRDSYFKTIEGSKWCIVEVVFILKIQPSPRLQYSDLKHLDNNEVTQENIRNAVIEIRSKKFPDWNEVGTAGSFFKNPIIRNEQYLELKNEYPGIVGYEQENGMVKVSLGFVLDVICGLKGYRKGKIRLFEKQALVLVADDGATAEEINLFANEIEKKVFEKTKIKIEREVKNIF